MSLVEKSFSFGDDVITLETGRVARQATGAVLARMGDTVILATVVAEKKVKEGMGFFPLSVHYQEKAYSAGRIPGGFLRREGKASDKEVLTSRLIDRPVRPLFPKDFKNEVQIVTAVLSTDQSQDPDILAMIATSAALAISGIPFQGPLGAARVGFIENEGYILNPSYEQLKLSELDMVVAGTKDAILMVESEAKELTEDEMLGAVLYAHQEYQLVVQGIKEFSEMARKPAWELAGSVENENVKNSINSLFRQKVEEAYQVKEKQERCNVLAVLQNEAILALEDNEEVDSTSVVRAFKALEKTVVRENVLSGKPRIDGRTSTEVRNISVDVGLLPKTHGSALFTRGETQALVTTTLGTSRDAQLIDALEGEYRDGVMLHYNFPSYSVGECGRMGPPGRREVGHGRLALRGIRAVLPSEEDFPYTIRLVSDITESNGSSSMATVCGSSLALMDAGVPLKAPVAGVAMGLVKDDDRFTVLTDILGDEDYLGDMDFKVAGTEQGVTALQMDIKIQGITEEIIEKALSQALEGRLFILQEMNKVISESRSELSSCAPVTKKLKINQDKIRDVIGKGGATIRSICDTTGASVDISDDGVVSIFAPDRDSCEEACKQVLGVTEEVEVGKVYSGVATRVVDFGVFVNILPGKDGLLHISQIADHRVERVEDYVTEGQSLRVLVTDVDNRGRIKLSMKGAPKEEISEELA